MGTRSATTPTGLVLGGDFVPRVQKPWSRDRGSKVLGKDARVHFRTKRPLFSNGTALLEETEPLQLGGMGVELDRAFG